MKKTILALFLTLGILTTIFGQRPSGVTIPTVIYKVDTTAYSNGLTIPAPFYFSVMSLSAEIDTALGFVLYSYTITSTDSTAKLKIKNDSIAPLKFYPLTIQAVDTLTLEGMIINYVKKNIEDIYGASNVTKLE